MSHILHKIGEKLHVGGHKEGEKHKKADGHDEYGGEQHKEGGHGHGGRFIEKVKDKIRGEKKDKKKKKDKKEKMHIGHGGGDRGQNDEHGHDYEFGHEEEDGENEDEDEDEDESESDGGDDE